MLSIPGQYNQALSMFGLMAIGYIAVNRICMCKGMAIGANQAGVVHMYQVIGNHPHKVNHGLGVTGRKIDRHK